ncbi:SGNH/GDSL hydrolase family protein [Tistrella bauzanensis]
MLFDLEQALRDGAGLGDLHRMVLANVDAWLGGIDRGGVDGSPFFDNIATASACFENLYADTAAHYTAEMRRLVARLRDRLDLNAVSSLYYAVNAAFLLNPTCHPDLADITPLGLVASRRPHRLLVNMGANEGLFMTCLTAAYNQNRIIEIDLIPVLLRALAERLRDHCPSIGRIYVNGLIRPRVVANLTPADVNDTGDGLGDGSYLTDYCGRLGRLGRLTQAEMVRFDNHIHAINDRMRAALADVLGSRAVFIDMYAFSDGFDAKHWGDGRALVMPDGPYGIRLSNLPMTAFVARGGLFSMDNLHPSSVGYALMANHVGAEIAATEGVAFTPVDPVAVWRSDSLLRNRPGSLDLLSLIGALVMSMVGLGRPPARA